MSIPHSRIASETFRFNAGLIGIDGSPFCSEQTEVAFALVNPECINITANIIAQAKAAIANAFVPTFAPVVA